MLRRKISVTLLSASFVVALACTGYAQNKAVVIPLNSSKPAVVDFVGGYQSFALTEADQVIRTVTLDLPSTGLVIANASGMFYTETASIAGPRCSITQGTTLDYGYMSGSLGMISSGMQAIPFGITRAFPLTAGTHVFNLVCNTFSGTVAVHNSNMNAVFYYMPEISVPVAAPSRVDKTCDNFTGSCPE